MKLNPIIAAACLGAAALGSAAMAQDLDTDGDGMYSMEEMLTAFPDLTEATFTTADANGDGVIDEQELAAAQADGLIPMREG